MNSRKILLLMFIPFVVFGVIATVFYIHQVKQGEARRKTSLVVKFDSSQIEKITVYDKNQTVGDGESKKLGESATSPAQIDVTKNSVVMVSYIAKNDYESSEKSIEVGNDVYELELSPDYSISKLSSLLPDYEVNNINRIIFSKYPSLSSGYTISRGLLLGEADWYGTTIVPKYKDIFYGDTFRIILQKQGGGDWVIRTKPEIILSKPIYPEIPPEIINQVNNLD